MKISCSKINRDKIGAGSVGKVERLSETPIYLVL